MPETTASRPAVEQKQSNGKKKKENRVLYTIKRMARSKTAVVAAIIMIILIFLTAFAKYIAPYPYEKINPANAFAAPSAEHWFGTDEFGRDILSRIIYGGRYTMSVGVLSVVISAFFGVLIGAPAGYFGGKFDNLVMRFLDIFSAFPNMLLAIALSAVFGTGFDKCIIALGICGIPNFARLIRANILTIRGTEYIESATSINCSTLRIIWKHALPNAISPLIVFSTMCMANSALTASALSFIGLGVQPPTPEWGAMLSASRDYIRYYPHMCLFPGAMIMLITLSFNMIGDALRDALDPKMKN